jgi:hypothetical protein
VAQGQREVSLRLLTTAGEVRGTAHLGAAERLIDFINRPDPAWRLTQASVEGSKVVHAFFAIERASVLAVIPRAPDALEQEAPAGGTPHSITCLIARGVEIEGTLSLRENVRVSDHLMRHEGFISLCDCTLFTTSNRTTQTEPAIPAVAVQAKRIVGVAE